MTKRMGSFTGVCVGAGKHFCIAGMVRDQYTLEHTVACLWPCFDDFTVNVVTQMQLKDYHFSHKFKQACQKNVVKYCSGSSQHDAKISK